MPTKLELQQALNRVNTEVVELRHKTTEQAQTIEDARAYFVKQRDEINTLRKSLTLATASYEIAKARCEEQKRWAVLYESKWHAAERKLKIAEAQLENIISGAAA